MYSDDIIDAIKISTIFFESNKKGDRLAKSENLNYLLPTSKFLDTSESSFDLSEDLKTYLRMNQFYQVILPNTFKCIQGLLALTASFIIVITSESLIDLFKDFSALSMISFVDNVSFKLCEDGIFGFAFVQKTEKVEGVELKRRKLKKGQVPLQTIIFAFLVIVMYTIWGVIAYRQGSGLYFRKVYPDCILQDNYLKIGDGLCNKWANTIGMSLKIIITIV